MIIIRSPDEATEQKGLGFLIGRYSGHSWATGEVLVPDEALAALAREGIRFTVEGPATYERILSLRDSLIIACGSLPRNHRSRTRALHSRSTSCDRAVRRSRLAHLSHSVSDWTSPGQRAGDARPRAPSIQSRCQPALSSQH